MKPHSMKIVDAQVHIWGADTPERPWPKRAAGRLQRDVPFGHAELLAEMDANGVDRAILVPPSFEGDRNDLAIAAAIQHPDRFAVMGRFDFEAPGAAEAIPGWLGQRGMLGMRFTFQTEAQKRLLTDSEPAWLWPALERNGIPIMLFPTGLLSRIDGLATRHPGLKIILDHMAAPTRGPKDDEAFAHVPQLVALARHANVAVKASSLPAFSSEPYPFPKLHKHLRAVVDAFGPARVFWGTDLTRLGCPYRQGVTMFTEALDWLKGDDLALVMGRGIADWLNWPL